MTRRLKSGIRIPTAATLQKYGMREAEWLALLASQDGVCPICRKVPPSGMMATDHHHVRGWKKMRPEDRRRYVRGVCCNFCNRNLLPYMMTAEKAARIASYLEAANERMEAWTIPSPPDSSLEP